MEQTLPFACHTAGLKNRKEFMAKIRTTISDENYEDLVTIRDKVLKVKTDGQVIEGLLAHARMTGFCAGLYNPKMRTDNEKE